MEDSYYELLLFIMNVVKLFTGNSDSRHIYAQNYFSSF